MIYSSAPRLLGAGIVLSAGRPRSVARISILMAYQNEIPDFALVRVPHLASIFWAGWRRDCPPDLAALYQHPVYYQETFVDVERFKGTCYKAPIGSTWDRRRTGEKRSNP